ncbi:MAG: hypothetical protein J0L97_04330, partial [Alphaproteobacteria bacterium]|nr:hypothetical protein [Alphaproteobacteria bacterium]
MVPAIRTPSRAPRFYGLIAFSALIMLVFGIIVAYQASESYRAALETAEEDAQRLTKTMHDHAELTFLAIDMALRRAADRNYINDLFGGNLQQDLASNLQLWTQETTQLNTMVMADDRGYIRGRASDPGYEFWLRDTYSVSTHPVFTALKDTSDDNRVAVMLDKMPAGAPGAGIELIVLSRSLSRKSGEFGGVVAGALNAHYFIEFFKSVERGRKSSLAIFDAQGNILIHGPADEEMLTAPVLDKLREAVRSGASSPQLTGRLSDDNVLTVYSYAKLSHVPLYVAVTLDESDFLSTWKSNRSKDIGFLAIFALFGSVLSFFALTMAKQIRRVEESEASAVLASQTKSEFLANMSHELRTPLNAIIGFSEMMDSGYFGPLNPKQKERIHDINLCGNHLLQLINDILEFSKGEAGKLELQEEVFALQDVVHECRRIMTEKCKMQGVSLQLQVEESLPLIFADKRKIRQILLNLLSNAIKFTPEGGRVTVSARLDHHRSMIFVVEDTGIGIAEEDIPK